MSANRDVKTPIKYLSIDEMMLKIAAMRAAALEQEQPAQVAPAVPEPAPIEEVLPEPLVFPEYVSHCELWCRTDDKRRTCELKAALTTNQLPLARRGREVAIRRDLPATPRVATAQYLLGSAAAIVGVLLLALGIGHLKQTQPAMMMNVPAYGDLVAGSDPWTEITNDDALVPTSAVESAPRRARPKIAPEQLEANVHRMLASNGFPDIGVSASHRGEVYLAGEVFSMAESDAIVRVAKLAANGGRVFFLHPEVREPEGSTFFGAIPDHAPDIWGARVRSVVIGSPAYKAGIVVGDVIREFGHATVGGANDLEKAVADYKPGQRVTVRIWRSGSIKYSIARLTGLREFASR